MYSHDRDVLLWYTYVPITYICPYNIYVLLWYICAPMIYMCPYDIHVSQWHMCPYKHLCTPITYMCSYDIHVSLWLICAPVTYMCSYDIYIFLRYICVSITHMSHSLLPDCSQHIFLWFSQNKYWASKNKSSSSMTVAGIILSAFKSEAWLGFMKVFLRFQ